MRAEDWMYAGEGGAHVIFSFQPCSLFFQEDNDDLAMKFPGLQIGCLLRVAKQDIVECMRTSRMKSTDTAQDRASSDLVERKNPNHIFSLKNIMDQNGELAAPELWYFVKVVAPTLQPFVDLPQLALLGSDLAANLGRNAIACGKIPLHRQSSWRIENDGEDDDVVVAAVDQSTKLLNDSPLKEIRGLIMRDYRLPRTLRIDRMGDDYRGPPPSSHDDGDDDDPVVLSVEIKPKAGYTAISPLVDPNRRAKYQKSRYQLLLHNSRCNTQYNPLDFFSRNKDRMSHSLRAVIAEPRNNFRMWLSNKRSSDHSHGQEGQVASSTNNLIQGNPDDLMPLWLPGSSTETLVELLVHVLCKEEEFLKTVNDLQRLDVIDSDGAVRIYEHMVDHWLQGSHEKAWELLDVGSANNGNSDNTAATNYHKYDRFSACPPVLFAGLGEPSAILETYLETVDELEKALECLTPNSDLDSSSAIERLHQKGVSLVCRMSLDDCIILLRLWLLSLAMCDVSFFVSFQLRKPQQQDTDETPINERLRVMARQTGQEPGCLLYQLRVHDGIHEILYEIKAIDCDPKPARKLKSRKKKEDAAFADLLA